MPPIRTLSGYTFCVTQIIIKTGPKVSVGHRYAGRFSLGWKTAHECRNVRNSIGAFKNAARINRGQVSFAVFVPCCVSGKKIVLIVSKLNAIFVNFALMDFFLWWVCIFD